MSAVLTSSTKHCHRAARVLPKRVEVLRDASTKSEERTREYANEASMREDVYKAKATAAANLRKTGAWDALSAEQKRLVDKMLLDGKRAGLALEKKEDKELLKRLKDDLSDVCLKFTVCTFFVWVSSVVVEACVFA